MKNRLPAALLFGFGLTSTAQTNYQPIRASIDSHPLPTWFRAFKAEPFYPEEWAGPFNQPGGASTREWLTVDGSGTPPKVNIRSFKSAAQGGKLTPAVTPATTPCQHTWVYKPENAVR